MSNLTGDQKKLLYLISKKGRVRDDTGNIVWLKDLSLLTLVFEGISRRLFEGYDYAPSLVKFRGVKLYANVSQEYLLDIDSLNHQDFVAKLKLNTKYYDTITAYSVTSKFNSVRNELPEVATREIDQLMSCPKCDSMIKVHIENGQALIICPECEYTRETGFFKIENIPYHSIAYFSGGGR